MVNINKQNKSEKHNLRPGFICFGGRSESLVPEGLPILDVPRESTVDTNAEELPEHNERFVRETAILQVLAKMEMNFSTRIDNLVEWVSQVIPAIGPRHSFGTPPSRPPGESPHSS